MKKKKNTAAMEEKIASAPAFEIDPAVGLTAEQVESRVKAGLVNKVKKHPTKTFWQIIVDNVFNYINAVLFLVCVLMVIAKLSFPHYFFMFILAANTGIGLYQDIHARILVDRLKVVSDPKATVLRDGESREIDAADIVLSDVVLFKIGDQILCDSTVVEGECYVDESLLTGESVPVAKRVGDQLLSGTFLVKGHAKAQAAKVGSANYAEALQGTASVFVQPKSEIKRSVSAFVHVTGTVALAIGLAMYLSYGFQTGDWVGFFTNYGMVESVSGSMVSMLPTGMFLLTSTSLAVGVIALSKQKMLVQQLYCIEMLARVDAICFDKTGTLTDGTMAVAEFLPLAGHGEEDLKTAIARVLHATQDTNATAQALRDACGESSPFEALKALPFDSASKYSAAEFEDGTFGFGAFGFLPLKAGQELAPVIASLAEKGYRVLVVGVSKGRIVKGKAPQGMEPIGLVALSDHIKEDAAENIAWFQGNDVKVRVISGDDPVTVAEIAKRVGVIDADKYVSLEGRAPEECKKLVDEYAVFGRVSPEQKAALIEAIKEQGHKVAMTGDGVNDILALKVADCSIAMASGSSAAQSVAHLVSLNNDFSKLPEVVRQGRRVINNLQRTCSLFLNKTFFAFILSVLFFFLQTFVGEHMRFPFKTQNLFVWECCFVGMAAFFLALQPSAERLKGSFMKNIVLRSLPAGVAQCICALLPLFVWIYVPESFTYLKDPDQIWNIAITLSVLSFTCFAFIVLMRVCHPYNKYRLVVCGCALASSLIAFVLDYFHVLDYFGFNFGVTYDGLSWGFLFMVAASVAIAGAVYYGLDALSYYLEGKSMEGRENHENQ